MSATHIALLRGINVGQAKRVAMADLRALIEGLGYAGVRTLLNSGNAVFTAPGIKAFDAAVSIEAAIERRFGFSSRVTTLLVTELNEVIESNPLTDPAIDPARLLVAIVADPADLAKVQPLLQQDWAPEALAIGPRAVYLYLPQGVLASRVNQEVNKILGDGVTSRSWQTLLKLQILAAKT